MPDRVPVRLPVFRINPDDLPGYCERPLGKMQGELQRHPGWEGV